MTNFPLLVCYIMNSYNITHQWSCRCARLLGRFFLVHIVYLVTKILPNLVSLRSADNSVRLFDRRNLTSDGVGSPVHMFEHHTAAVLCVQVFHLLCSVNQ